MLTLYYLISDKILCDELPVRHYKVHSGRALEGQIWRSSRQLVNPGLASGVALQPVNLCFFVLLFPFLQICLRNKVPVLHIRPTLSYMHVSKT